MAMAMWIADLGTLLANPFVALGLRVALGLYVIFMARGYYADPGGSIQKYIRWLPNSEWARQMLRGIACFCVWGGCFIIATALATQLADLHGPLLAVLLVLVATIATYLALPKSSEAGASRREDA